MNSKSYLLLLLIIFSSFTSLFLVIHTNPISSSSLSSEDIQKIYDINYNSYIAELIDNQNQIQNHKDKSLQKIYDTNYSSYITELTYHQNQIKANTAKSLSNSLNHFEKQTANFHADYANEQEKLTENQTSHVSKYCKDDEDCEKRINKNSKYNEGLILNFKDKMISRSAVQSKNFYNLAILTFILFMFILIIAIGQCKYSNNSNSNKSDKDRLMYITEYDENQSIEMNNKYASNNNNNNSNKNNNVISNTNQLNADLSFSNEKHLMNKLNCSMDNEDQDTITRIIKYLDK